jgi:hypothetical protein
LGSRGGAGNAEKCEFSFGRDWGEGGMQTDKRGNHLTLRREGAKGRMAKEEGARGGVGATRGRGGNGQWTVDRGLLRQAGGSWWNSGGDRILLRNANSI